MLCDNTKLVNYASSYPAIPNHYNLTTSNIIFLNSIYFDLIFC